MNKLINILSKSTNTGEKVETTAPTPIYDWISSTFGISQEYAPYFLIGSIVLIVLLIALIITICVIAKKKKDKKKSNIETKVPNETIVANDEKKDIVKIEEEVEPAKVETENVEPVEVKVEPVKEETSKVKNVSPTPKKKVVKPQVKTTSKTNSKKPVSKKEVKKEEEEIPVTPFKGESAKRNLGKFTISQEGPNYRYRLKASNGELLVVSELYTSENSARTGIETIKKNADSEKIEVVEDKHGLFSFRVMTKQGRILATSANYKTKNRALSASESFRKFVITDKIELEDSADDHFEVEEFKKDINPEEKGKFRINPQGDGFIYQLYASNGRVIATSQVYKSEVSCREGLEKFRGLAYDGSFYIFKDKNDKYQFKLYNKQKRLVLAGEVYDTKDRVISVIESIKRFAKLAEVVENSPETVE